MTRDCFSYITQPTSRTLKDFYDDRNSYETNCRDGDKGPLADDFFLRVIEFDISHLEDLE